jgi:hypothetical protein
LAWVLAFRLGFLGLLKLKIRLKALKVYNGPDFFKL